MYKTTPPGRWIEEVKEIFLCWEHCWQFVKSFWKVMDSFILLGICKFGSFKNPLAKITSLSELYFRFRRFILFVQTKKVISMKYGRTTSSWKLWRWVRLDLILTIKNTYINPNLNPLTKLTSFKDIFPWNISQMITKTAPISTRTVISYAINRFIPLWI